MKKYILIVVAILILGWLVFDKVKNVGLTEEFVVKQDSLVHVVDSLHEDNHQKELQIYFNGGDKIYDSYKNVGNNLEIAAILLCFYYILIKNCCNF